MAARTLCWKGIQGFYPQRQLSLLGCINFGLNQNGAVNQKNLCAFRNIKLIGVTPFNLLKFNFVKQSPSIFQPLVRNYAKSRDKKKSDKGSKKKVNINEEIVSEVINNEVMKEQMHGVIEKLKDDYIKNLSIRSTTGSIETLPITFEGKDYILQDLAQIVRKNPKTVVVNMDSFPQVIPTVVQAISQSGMNLNPQQDGTTLFIPIPKVTKDHRESLAKNAKALFVKCRDNIKDIQNKYIKAVKNKEKDGLARDTALQITEYISFVATEYISTAEKMMDAKQNELLKDSQ